MIDKELSRALDAELTDTNLVADVGGAERTAGNGNKTFHEFSASELMDMDLPDIFYPVENILPQGLAFLVAKSKYGKSWMSIYLGGCVATGTDFLGCRTFKGDVLYISLEDSKARLKKRLSCLDMPTAPENFFFDTEAENLDNGLIDQINDFMLRRPNTKLIILDVFAKIRSEHYSNNAYTGDYRETTLLKQCADKYGICILLVHHTNKSLNEDIFDSINGSTGLMGCSDTVLILHKEDRQDNKAVLYVTGRDVEQQEIPIIQNKDNMRWEVCEDARAEMERRERDSFNNNPLYQTIIKLVDAGFNHEWQGTMSMLKTETVKATNHMIAERERALSERIRRDDALFVKYANIEHFALGTHGKHIFRRIVETE